MPFENILLQLGQCGNQIGTMYWEKICEEHGISKTGAFDKTKESEIDNKEICFSQREDDKYVPRAILMDLEPRVVQSVLSSEYSELYKGCRSFTSKGGRGSSNSWACGYSQSAQHDNEIFNVIRSEVECADNLEAFTLCHSLAGGTGSGMGSYLLENLCDQYPKKLVTTFSIFPNQDESSNVVIEPYNSILAIRRLITFADMVTVFDNHALTRVAHRQLGIQKSTVHEFNDIIAKVMCMMTSTIRFPSYINNNMISIVSSMCPTMKLHFVLTSYKPLKTSSRPIDPKKNKLLTIMQSLNNPKNYMASTKMDKDNPHCYITAMNIIKNNLDVAHLNAALSHIRDLKLMNFITWGPGALQVVTSKSSPYMDDKRLTGLMLANHTSFGNLFNSELNKFERLMFRSAFLGEFKRYDMFKDGLFEFEESKNEVQNVVDEYGAATTKDFLNWIPNPPEFKF